MEKVEKGEAIDPSSYYFQITPYFETAAPQYGWLNRVVSVGIGHPKATGQSTASLRFSEPRIVGPDVASHPSPC